MTRKCGGVFRAFELETALPAGLVRLVPAQRPKRMQSTVRLQAAHIRRGGNAELAFQYGDTRLQQIIFLACDPRHVLDRLELLTLHNVEVAQDLLRLVADHRVDLALDALSRAGGV